MRSFSPLLVVLIGAVLAQANVHHRRYVNDQDSENQIDSTGTLVEEPERHYHHHRHHHGRQHRFNRVHRGSNRRANLSEAEETIEFHRFYMRNVRSLAEESGLRNEDINTLLNIMEENRKPFKKEDRSQWTEEQWQKSKEECDQRKQLIRAQAFAQIQDQIHLTIFFDKLEAQKKLMKENIHKYIVGRLTRIAIRSGLNDSQIEKFVRELESHKPVGVHWRPGMSQNEKRKNVEIHVRNWLQIKEACLRDASEAEQAQFKRFFAAVEKDFARSMSGDHPRMRHHHRRHHSDHYRRHQVDEEFPRDHVHRDSESESLEPEVHHHRHHRHHPHHDAVDEDFGERPRQHHRRHHEMEDEELAPLRRRRSDEIYDSEERDVRPHYYRRRHYHHRRPNYVDSEERVDYGPEHHHRRHHKVREEVPDSSEQQRDEDFEPRRHHHRHHSHRHEYREQIDDSKVRSEPYRQYRRPVRRGDVEE